MERKQQIRADLKKKRNALSKEQTREFSRRICETLFAYILSEEQEVIYCYYPLGNEVDLLWLAESLLRIGKQVAFPRTNGTDMEFYPVKSLDGFQKGAFGIMEPVGECPLKEEKPLVLVPGLGFDIEGNRMGYGKGFYDRYFARFPASRKVGVAYNIQMTEEIPKDEYDIPMDFVITEEVVK